MSRPKPEFFDIGCHELQNRNRVGAEHNIVYLWLEHVLNLDLLSSEYVFRHVIVNVG